MRASFAAISSDRVSSSAVVLASLLCGVSVFFVALPLAQSSPFPTPREGGWITEDAAPAQSYHVASASSVRVASLSPRPVAAPVSVPDHVGTQAAIEWEAMIGSAGVLDAPVAKA